MGKSDQILRQYINKSKFYSDLKIENYFKKLSVEMAILTKQDIQTKV